MHIPVPLHLCIKIPCPPDRDTTLPWHPALTQLHCCSGINHHACTKRWMKTITRCFWNWRAERQGNMFFKRLSIVFGFAMVRLDMATPYILFFLGPLFTFDVFFSLSIPTAGRYAPRRCASMPRLCWSWPCSGQLGRWSKCSPFSPCLDTSTWGEMPKKNRSTIIG